MVTHITEQYQVNVLLWTVKNVEQSNVALRTMQ